MLKQKKGPSSIFRLSPALRASLAGVQYTAAKAGVEGLTRQLAYDYGKSGIRVNAVAPTVTLTGDRIQGLWEAKSEEEKKRSFQPSPWEGWNPRGSRLCRRFLASDESSYITGITIDVNGGRYLR
jgi:NAD(P)-dependent dehydrogenase (short-subunit alcohol dehydrogenase family)